MKNFRLIVISLFAVLGIALTQLAPTPAYATADSVVRNTSGFFAKRASDSKYYPAQLCFSTDGNQALIPCREGGTGILPNAINTANTNVTASAYVALYGVTPAAATSINVYNGTSQVMVVATGTTGSWVNKFYVPPTAASGPVKLFLPASSWIAVESAGSTASSGLITVNLLQ